MQEKLIAVYNELYEQRGREAEEAYAILEKTIKDLDLEGRVRADAKLFLLVNMEELVMTPFRRVDPNADVARILENDIPLILHSARDAAETAGRGRIKARDAVEGTLATWDGVLMHIDPVPEA